ncbi:MAG: hypothetical protein IPF79_04930 [Ignavibacteria bacterium]|nr:hypothetical protein [Ignavibacteria bacterium]
MQYDDAQSKILPEVSFRGPHTKPKGGCARWILLLTIAVVSYAAFSVFKENREGERTISNSGRSYDDAELKGEPKANQDNANQPLVETNQEQSNIEEEEIIPDVLDAAFENLTYRWRGDMPACLLDDPNSTLSLGDTTGEVKFHADGSISSLEQGSSWSLLYDRNHKDSQLCL